MYLQLTKARYQRETLEDARAIIRDSVLPAATQQRGFRGAYWAVDRETGTGIGISLWDTRADAEALVASGFYQEQVAKLGSLLVAPPEREVYEVAAEA